MDSMEDTRLVIRRTIKAPVSRVYRAWTEPAALRHWFAASDKHECSVAEADLRVGGRYRLAMRAPDGEEHRVSGVYREIDPDRRLVFTWAWESTPERESVVTIELQDRDGETELVLTHDRFADKAARDLHGEGWAGCIDNFVRFAESGLEPWDSVNAA